MAQSQDLSPEAMVCKNSFLEVCTCSKMVTVAGMAESYLFLFASLPFQIFSIMCMQYFMIQTV